jgi:hypothetical protein
VDALVELHELSNLLAQVERERQPESTPEEEHDLEGDAGVLEQLQGASVLGRVATGPRAGQRVLRLGSDPTGPVYSTGGSSPS